MKVFCNGFPKSGNHALTKAVELLGLPASVNHHTVEQGVPEDCEHILIVRDPRNVIVSWLRWERDAVTPGKFLARFRKFRERSLIEEMSEFEGWLDTAFVVRYEDLTNDPFEMRRIASHLGVPYPPGAFSELPGLTVTWNGAESDYRPLWTREVIDAWYNEGGGDLLSRWGY